MIAVTKIHPNAGRNLDEMRKYVESFSDLVETRKKNKVIMDNGRVVSTGLFKEPHIGIAVTELQKGAKMRKHKHKAKEWVIVYRGSLVVQHDKELITLKAGDSWYINPNIPHRIVEVLEEAKIVAITVPLDKGWPDAR